MWFGVAAGCLVVGIRESRIRQIETLAAAGTMGAPIGEMIAACDVGCNPREALAAARLTTVEALAMPPGRRRQSALSDAERMLGKALVRRPDWSAALVERSFIMAQKYGPIHPKTVAALSDSYRAPYLLQAARWRVMLAGQVWDRMSEESRTQAVAEALWFGRLDPGNRRQIEALLGPSAMGRQVRLLFRTGCERSTPHISC